MDKITVWLAVYAACRQAGDDHETSCKNASDALQECQDIC